MTPCNPASHIVDSRFYASGYSTTEVKRIFCDLYRYQRWLDVEAALAEAQASLGIIPQDAAEEIRTAADIRRLDLDVIKKELKVSNHSLMPLLNALSAICGETTRGFIHFGATTQDIQDTAMILEIKDVVDIVQRDLELVMYQVADLAERFEGLAFIGRTHTQYALPMTLGLKMAGWLDELLRNYQRLHELEDRLVVSQLFGGVGTMDAFGPQGFALLELFSKKLGLSPPLTAWHNARDRLAEFLSVLGMISGALARIADEIRGLSRSETGELEEPFHKGKMGSSTMPHKRNPEMCEQVVVLAKLVKANVLLGMDGLMNEHERDYRSVRLEWVTIADSSHFTCAALALMKDILGRLIVHEDRIGRNVNRAAPLMCTEALMFYLGKGMGKDKAHSLLYEASMEASETGQDLVDVLMERTEIGRSYTRDEIEGVINPSGHIGMSHELTRNVVEHARARLGRGPRKGERFCPLASQEGGCSVEI